MYLISNIVLRVLHQDFKGINSIFNISVSILNKKLGGVQVFYLRSDYLIYGDGRTRRITWSDSEMGIKNRLKVPNSIISSISALKRRWYSIMC